MILDVNAMKERRRKVKKLKEKTGFHEITAQKKISSMTKSGISFSLYMKKCLYDLTEEELFEYVELRKKHKDMLRHLKGYYQRLVVDRTGLSEEEVMELMDKSKKKGISYHDYVMRGCYMGDLKKRNKPAKKKTSGQKNGNAPKKASQTAPKKQEPTSLEHIEETSAQYRKQIMDATGWSFGKTELEVLRARVLCRCSYEDYYVLKFYEKTKEEMLSYVTYGLFDLVKLKYNNITKGASITAKHKFNKNYSKYINRIWFTSKRYTYEDFWKQLEGISHIIVKPIDAERGMGIAKYECPAEEKERHELYEKINQGPFSIVEECVIQHPEMAGFCSTSVNTIRIATIVDQGECQILYAVLRMGKDGIVDNFHAGGIAADIDIDTGVVRSCAVDLHHNTYDKHPLSGKQIPGFQIPHWDQIVSTCKEAALVNPHLKIIGWDFAVTEDGVEVIEGNTMPSYVLCQIPAEASGYGLRSRMIDPYLPDVYDLEKETEKELAYIADKAGCTKEEAALRLQEAKELGIHKQMYLDEGYYHLTTDEIKVMKTKKTQTFGNKMTIAEMAEAAGKTTEEIKAHMELANQIGIGNIKYVDEACYLLTETQMQELCNKIEAEKAEAAAIRMEKLMELQKRTGWSMEKILLKLSVARTCSFTLNQYLKKELYHLTAEELQEFDSLMAQQSVMYQENKEIWKKIVVRRTGKSMEEVAVLMEEAGEQGISYEKFASKECWNLSKEELEELSLKSQERSSQIEETKQMYLDKICEETGWNRAKAEMEVIKARINCRCSFEDYCIFRLYNKTPEEQRTYATYGIFNFMREWYNDSKYKEYVGNKALFNEKFHEFVDRKWFLSDDLTKEALAEKIKGIKDLIIKPIDAQMGVGVMKVSTSEDLDVIYQMIQDSHPAIIEECIVQHPDMASFCDTSVNTVRIATLLYNNECNFLYAVLRMGRGQAVDNFHAGGVVALVDIETGTVCSNAADFERNEFEYHPYSNKKLKGFQIPHWDMILESCKKAVHVLPECKLLGWDFAVTEDGVEIIEGNSGLSYVLPQVPASFENIGLRPTMIDPYFQPFE